MVNSFLVFITTLIVCSIIYAQNNLKINYRLVGDSCEGCVAVLEYGDRNLFPVDTLPDFHDDGPKLKLTGTIYLQDEITPAKDVILYVYHTDQNGIYPKKRK